MRNLKLISVALCMGAASFFINGCKSNVGDSFTEAQKAQIDQEVHDYLVKNPEVLVEVSQKLQEKMMAEQAKKTDEAVKSNLTSLLNNADSPVIGNPQGTVTLVEFFDYQCVHCAGMYPIIKKIVTANSNLKVVLKELPIFGKESEYAAAAALAAGKQGKYLEMHNALFDSGKIEGKMTTKAVDEIAAKVGLNVAKLKKDMESEAVQKELNANHALAQTLGMRGTPAFLVAPSNANSNTPSEKLIFLPGRVPEIAIQDAINKVK